MIKFAPIAIALIAVASPADAANWTTAVNTDQMSGTKTTLIMTPAVAPPSFKGRTLRSRLAIQCPPKKSPQVFVDLDFPISRTSEGAARIKFDDSPPKTITGQRSDDGEALFLPGSSGIIQSLMKAKEFRVEVKAATQQAIVLTFKVEGLAEQKEGLATCGVRVK